jgi:hypothetical protein
VTVYDVAAKLPPIDVLRDRSRALAMLDSIIGGDFYDFDPSWRGSAAASMRNGSGDEYNIVFTRGGAFIRGNYHDSPMHMLNDGRLWPGLLNGLPARFEWLAREPAFSYENGELEATFVLWRGLTDDQWHAGAGIDFSRAEEEEDDPDGSWLLDILCDEVAQEYVQYVQEVYEIDLAPAAVEHVLTLPPLTDAAVRALNPKLSLVDVREKAAKLGYPVETTD